MSVLSAQRESAAASAVAKADFTSADELQKAFAIFAATSEELSQSYRRLEQQVVDLSGELASLSDQRLHELNEKEHLAEQLESLLRLLPAAVIVLDNRGLIRRANPTAVKWLKQALMDDLPASLLGKPWKTIVRAAFAPKHTDYHEVSLRDGRLVSLATSPLEGSGQLIMMTDQSETRALQAKVARQQRLTAMGQMVASLAHQIRTPLSAALLYAANLHEADLQVAKRRQFSEKLLDRLHHLERQVQDMLLFVKGEVNLSQQRTLDQLYAALRAATASLPQPQQSRLVWPQQCPKGLVLCQPDMLISALMNVINNALEAQPNAVSPIEMRAVSHSEDVVEMIFKDQGPGLNATEIKKIQEPFYTTKSHGTGLGIPVLIATIKAHHGTVEINSCVGKGTEFRLTLPLIRERKG